MVTCETLWLYRSGGFNNRGFNNNNRGFNGRGPQRYDNRWLLFLLPYYVHMITEHDWFIAETMASVTTEVSTVDSIDSDNSLIYSDIVTDEDLLISFSSVIHISIILTIPCFPSVDAIFANDRCIFLKVIIASYYIFWFSSWSQRWTASILNFEEFTSKRDTNIFFSG